MIDNFTALEERDLHSQKCERALLIGLKEGHHPVQEGEAHIQELQGLTHTLGIQAVDSLILPCREINPRWLLGRGKVEELKDVIRELRADLVIFDHDLSPGQQRNLEQEWRVAVIDRREVIIDIFADRASTREAILQTALARMDYSLPRLTRAWTHLSRQRGGARGNRGKGETQLESDRRLVLDKIARLKREIKKVREQREVRRKRRRGRPVPSVSLVGYTNAGKSSLLNALAGSRVKVENRLFATLDPTTRRVELEGGRELVLTDTVGFIRKLPHDLVEAFHATLEEAVLADVILHVVDADSPEREAHREVTERVLEELGAGEKSRILVLNKADNLDPEAREFLRVSYPEGLFVSARTGEGLKELRLALIQALDKELPLSVLLIPADSWNLRSRIHRDATIVKETYSEEGTRITARLSREDRGRFEAFLQDS